MGLCYSGNFYEEIGWDLSNYCNSVCMDVIVMAELKNV